MLQALPRQLQSLQLTWRRELVPWWRRDVVGYSGLNLILANMTPSSASSNFGSGAVALLDCATSLIIKSCSIPQQVNCACQDVSFHR